MNDYYSYEKKLNIKKVIIAIAILLAIVIVIIVAISKNKNKDNNTNNTTNSTLIEQPSPSTEVENENKKEELSTNIVYQDINKTISVELKRSYGLEVIQPQDNRLLILQSNDNLSLYISKLDLIPNRDFLDIVTADKDSYVNNIGPYSNLTELRELQVGSLRAFTYGLQFLETTSNSAYILQIVWLETPDCYYVFDVEYPLSDDIYFQTVLTEALSTFSIEALKPN